MRRAGWIVIAVIAVVVAAGFAGAAVIYLRDFHVDLDYPDVPAVPPGATVLASGEGWDDDDPIRTRAVVVDGDDEALLEFYRQAYPGFKDVPVKGQALCLVEQGPDYTEVVDVWEYEGTRVAAQPGRYLVSTSRYSATGPGPKGYCGNSNGWLPIDLVTADPLPG